MENGMIEIYTGDGKGKTTASVGLAIRAVAHNFKVCFTSFFKPPDTFDHGEAKILRKVGVEIRNLAPHHLSSYKDMGFEEARKRCLEALATVRELFQGSYDLLILDEMNIVVREGYLKEDEILDLFRDKPETLELVLTGRGATRKIMEKADLVSEIGKIRHPYDRGISEREGIDA